MKKLIAVLCVMALMAAAVLPALAEQNGGMPGGQMPQMNDQGGPGGGHDRGNGQAPSGQPGGNTDGTDAQTPPEKPEGDTTDTQTPPEKPEGDTTDTQTPPEKPEGDTAGTDGQTPPAMPGDQGGQPGQDSLKKLVEDGTLSQTAYDAVQEYIRSHADTGDTQTPPEKPEGDTTGTDAQNPPEKPEGDDQAPQGQPGIGGLTQEMLQAMLDDGIITEAEYTAILGTLTAPAETETDTDTSDDSDEAADVLTNGING